MDIDKAQAIELMDQIKEMQETDGWEHIEKFIQERIADNKEQLLTCNLDNLNNVIEHRAKVKAFNSVFLYIQEIMEKGKKALESEVV